MRKRWIVEIHDSRGARMPDNDQRFWFKRSADIYATELQPRPEITEILQRARPGVPLYTVTTRRTYE